MMIKKTFKSLYENEKKKPTAAQLFIARVAAITKRSEMTVRMWLSGRQEPDELAKSVIAREFGSDAASLFPPKKTDGVHPVV